jgi:hypothetical protein
MTDRRVPGVGAPSHRRWRCPVPGCKERTTAHHAPECPQHHVRMELPDDPRIAQRRAAIQEERGGRGETPGWTREGS